jgi:hypothetical protein
LKTDAVAMSGKTQEQLIRDGTLLYHRIKEANKWPNGVPPTQPGLSSLVGQTSLVDQIPK